MTGEDFSGHWGAERVARQADLFPAPEFCPFRHRTLRRYQQALDAWEQECARRRLALFDRHVASLGIRSDP